MALLSDLLPLLRPELRGCPDFTIEAYILRVVRDFCSHTWAWSEWISEVYSSDQDRYTLVLSGGKEIVGVRHLWVDGQKIVSTAEEIPGADDDNDDDIPESRAYIFYPPSDIRLFFNPGDGQDFYVYAALRPSLYATTFPDWMISNFEDGLMAGVKSRLMMQPGQNWSNPELGQYYSREYKRAIGHARIVNTKKYAKVSAQVQPKSLI